MIFKGFNGSDDLHYAMLAARMVRGEYNPFEPRDIYSGRILLIASQAAIYRVAGINTFSTLSGSAAAVIISCYLTVCRLLPVKNAAGTLIACFLFYFNPVLTYLTVGIQGDVYVLLAGVVICIMLRSWIRNNKTLKRDIITGSAMAFIIAVSLLYKETILVFLPFVCVTAFLYNRVHAGALILSVIITFACMLLLYGCFYYHFTGDAFFRIVQIKNSSYPNHCSYDLLPVKYLIIRLTYGEWQEFIVRGFYPVISGAVVSALVIFTKESSSPIQNIYPLFFAVLLVTGFYFPFSFNGYQPLCADARQFLFLLPLGVIVTTDFICNDHKPKHLKSIFICGSLAVLTVCMSSTGNKWQWMIYLFITIFAVAVYIPGALPRLLLYAAVSGILWMSILERLFFKNSNWFHDMIALDKRISSACYYFPDHDNMMHWKLLHHFSHTALFCYNLDKHSYKAYKVYYQQIDPGSFHPGWLIINQAYTIRSAAFLKKVDSLENVHYFIKETGHGDMRALLIDSPGKLSYMQSLVQSDD